MEPTTVYKAFFFKDRNRRKEIEVRTYQSSADGRISKMASEHIYLGFIMF